jgi:hypothetical protein
MSAIAQGMQGSRPIETSRPDLCKPRIHSTPAAALNLLVCAATE